MRLGLVLIGGYMKNNKFIIDTPDLQSLRLRYTSTLLTLIFWVIWFYLWIPIITLVGWWFQVQVFEHTMITMGGFQSFLDELPAFASYILILVLSLALWSAYNYFRFKGLERRKPLSPATRMDILKKFQIDDKDLDILRQSQIVSVTFDENDDIHPVKVK